MTGRIQLPDAVVGGLGPDVKLDAANMRRMISQLTVILNDLSNRLAEVERVSAIQTDVTLAPIRVGQIAVEAGIVYVAVGLTNADWVVVS